jgi:hypothetical protein
MRRDETLHEYTKEGMTNIKLFEKIHEADAHTIEDHVWFEDRWMVASLCDE